jgi:Bacterial alpha-L-rhamnosidase 6 hairpin glycosidase domain
MLFPYSPKQETFIVRKFIAKSTYMVAKKCLSLHLFFVILFIEMSGSCFAQAIKIRNDIQDKKIVFGNAKIKMSLDYDQKANISLLVVNGQKVIEGAAGVYSRIRTNGTVYSTLHLSSDPSIHVSNNIITITGIIYGDKSLAIHENWTFSISDSIIKFDLDRTLSRSIAAEQAALPVFMFSSINTWDGAYQDYGGIAWFYLFNRKSDTYGVHSNSSRFWNSKTGNGLTVSVDAPGNQVAMDYSRTADDKLAYRIGVSPNEIMPRFDSGTYRRRYIRDSMDVWAPFKINTGKTTQSITLSYFNFNDQFGRGNLVGINGKQVSAVLNTIARIGVIDKEHFGGNSWHTPYGPICLHEQYIAQMGLAINDNDYLKGYRQCLDFYRDNAIKPDGRVWPRWAYSNEDMMPGEVSDKGFYEAQWGYLLDSNPDLVTNVAELYDQTGDEAWVKTHQRSCERALDWILKRDSNNNGLVEMITDSHLQKRGSDWLDIIWASYENAFVNAKLYHALVLWAAVEKQLGNTGKENYYNQFAAKLKTSYNKPVREGGFWDDEKKCYIHWRDKDGSIHGNNMVTPVNFMAIAYGICDDDSRRKIILDNIETQMQKEKLFFWPVCMYTYSAGEGNDWQFPFPNYENGDLFLSWGAVAVKAYAAYKPELAVKYVKNVLAQYAKDGLAFQRYGRVKQDGLGDDILSGNSLSVVGLYQAVYGINPLYNRFYLNPHITQKLSGTKVKYNFRDQKLTIGLNLNKYSVSNSRFKIISKTDFGFYSADKSLLYFNGSSDHASMKVTTSDNSSLVLDIKVWSPDQISWTQSSKDRYSNKLFYHVNDLKRDTVYTISINNKIYKQVKSNSDGTLIFDYETNKKSDKIVVVSR